MKKKNFAFFFFLAIAAATIGFAEPSTIILNDLTGIAVPAESLLSGERKILFFWASWCHFCRRELENLPAHREFMAKHGIDLIAVNVGEPTAAVSRYKERSGFPYPIVLDSQGTLSDSLSILGIPTFVYFSKGKELERTNYFSPVQASQIFKIEEKREQKEVKRK